MKKATWLCSGYLFVYGPTTKKQLAGLLKAGIYADAGKNTCGSIYDKDSLGIGVGIYFPNTVLWC